MKSYLGTYQATGKEPVEATILIFDKTVHIGYRNENGSIATLTWAIMDIEPGLLMAGQSSRLRHLQDRSAEVIIPGKDPAEQVRALQEEQLKPWHRKSRARDWGRGLLVFGVVTGLLVAIYFLMVPWLSEKMAAKVPVETEQEFGEAVYSSLGIAGQEDTAASYDINHFFAAMNIRSPYQVRVSVVRGDIVNAFALPGGRIVVYDALIRKLGSYPELAALLSHEFSHVNNKHSTRAIFRQLGSRIFLSLLLGKLGAVTSVLADQADHLKSLHYSRALEREADMEGLAILLERKIDPQGFSDLFRHLREAAPSSQVPEILGSHPDIEKRIAYLRDAAGSAPPSEDLQLKTIFENLKQKLQP